MLPKNETIKKVFHILQVHTIKQVVKLGNIQTIMSEKGMRNQCNKFSIEIKIYLKIALKVTDMKMILNICMN